MKLLLGISIAFYFLFTVSPSFAKSEYVLPYPSAMPGSVFYKLNLVKEEILKYWHFGDFGQFHFNLKQSDKYLVEAKTLYDYKQYLLGQNALQKSDAYFEKVYPSLLSAKNKGKNIFEKEKVLKAAAQKHKEELLKIKNNVPPAFVWTPERERPTKLNLWEGLNTSIEHRGKRL